MGTVCICLFVVLYFCYGAASEVWMKMSEDAVNAVSNDMIERYPSKVFDLSPLVVNTSQLRIYSVDVHSPVGVRSSVEVSKVSDGRFNATYRLNSLIIDVTGQAALGVLKFRIDSRVILRNSILSVGYRVDETTMLSATSCGFNFVIERIILKERRLQQFVGMWRSQFKRMPTRAICYQMSILQRNQPLFMFGLPGPPLWVPVVPRSLRIEDSYLYIGFQERGDRSPVSNFEAVKNIQIDDAAMLNVFFPSDFFSDVTDHVIDGVLQKRFIDVSSSQVTTKKLGEYFEKGQSVFEGRPGYHGDFSIDIQSHSTRIAEDGLFSTVPFTLHYNVSSMCGDYHLFSLDWILEISLRVTYNDYNFYLRVSDIRSDITLTDSKLGNVKNLSKLAEDLRLSVYVKEEILEDLAFFLNNTGILHNTVFTGKKDYVLLLSNTTSQYGISNWKDFGSDLSGNDIKTNSATDQIDTVDLAVCNIGRLVRSQAARSTPFLTFFVIVLWSLVSDI